MPKQSSRCPFCNNLIAIDDGGCTCWESIDNAEKDECWYCGAEVTTNYSIIKGHIVCSDCVEAISEIML